MTKSEFIKEYAKRNNITQKLSKEYIETLQDILFEHINDEDGIKIVDGLTLMRSYRDGRHGRNPKTGETIEIEGKYIPRAKFGKLMKEAVN